MSNKNIFLSSIVLFILFLSSCGQNASKTSNNASDSTTIEKVETEQPKDSAEMAIQKLTDIANFITGLPVSNGSQLEELTKTPEWVDYAAEAKVAWSRFDSIAAKYMAFSKSEITAPYDTIKNLFYPFSGPDFLFANIMFPNVDKMTLIGLEGPGSLPQINSETKDSLKKILEMYKVSIEDVTQLSFFRTIDMKNELGNKAIDGTAPIILLFLAKSGNEIVDFNLMNLNKKGELVKEADKKNAIAVEIKYRKKGDDKVKSIVYLSTNLADPTLSKNIPFVNFLKNVDNNCVTFVKSATYLMHKSYFSIIRNTCLEKSALILQDESGIAYKYFNKEQWDIQLYGTYSKPIKLFADFFQPDYLQAFKTSKPKKLGFRIGYSPKSDLLMAKRK
jgi:hypothetical protein